jgi:hypothetical protein
MPEPAGFFGLRRHRVSGGWESGITEGPVVRIENHADPRRDGTLRNAKTLERRSEIATFLLRSAAAEELGCISSIEARRRAGEVGRSCFKLCFIMLRFAISLRADLLAGPQNMHDLGSGLQHHAHSSV